MGFGWWVLTVAHDENVVALTAAPHTEQRNTRQKVTVHDLLEDLLKRWLIQGQSPVCLVECGASVLLDRL